jgi:drug/metabolite transporter (DMT)-like permease|tara:strand:+ start:221 stop:1114 length:894 start_codon:yes stop_codon:yes gene_type:complete
MKSKPWLIYAIVTTLFWGLWGAFTGLSAGDLPETMIYVIWAATMVPPAIFALKLIGWELQYDKKSILLGCIIGFLGAGGQMILFHTVTVGPTYLIFPIIALSPIVTVALSYLFLKERTTKLGALGVVLALVSLQMFEYSSGNDGGNFGILWFPLALCIMAAWGVQAYFMKLSNVTMHAESIFFYMMLTSLLLIPVALWMTDMSVGVQWTAEGIGLAAGIQILNSLGALCLVYAFRYGKAIVVSPMTNAGAPLITAVIALIILGVVPDTVKIAGIVLAIIAALLLAIEPEEEIEVEAE